MGVSAELRMPTHKWEGTWATHSLTRLGRTMRKFLGVRCGSFLGFWVRCGRMKLVSSSLGCIRGVSAELPMPTHKGEGTLPGWVDLCANFLGFGAVVFWGFGVRCGRVKLVSSSLGCIRGVSAELRMPTHRGRVPGLPIVLPGWVDPCAYFLGSGAVVSSSLGCIRGVSAELRMPTHKGEGTWATHSLTRLGRPMCKFLGSIWGVSAELRMLTHKGEGTWATHSLTRL